MPTGGGRRAARKPAAPPDGATARRRGMDEGASAAGVVDLARRLEDVRINSEPSAAPEQSTFARVKSTEEFVKELEARIAETEEELNNLNSEKEDLKNGLKKLEGSINRQETQIDGLEEEKERLRAEGDRAAVNSISGDIRSLRDGLTEDKRSRTAKENRLGELEGRISAKEKEIASDVATVNRLMGFDLRAVQFWAALGCGLPDAKFPSVIRTPTEYSKYGETDVKKMMYRPLKVYSFTKANFGKIVETYVSRARHKSLKIPSIARDLETALVESGARSEADVESLCKNAMSVVLRILWKEPVVKGQILSPCVERISITSHGEWPAKADICVEMSTRAAGDLAKGKLPLSPGRADANGLESLGFLLAEVKTPRYYTDDNASLAERWCNKEPGECDEGCTAENHPKLVDGPKGGELEKRTTWFSPIKQVYSYLATAKLRLGLITTYEQWWFVARDCAGNMFISESYNQSDISTGDRSELPVVTVPQALTAWAALAMDSDAAITKALKNGLGDKFKKCPPRSSSGTGSGPSGAQSGGGGGTGGGSQGGGGSGDNQGSDGSEGCDHRLEKRSSLPKNVRGPGDGKAGGTKRRIGVDDEPETEPRRVLVSLGVFPFKDRLGPCRFGAAWRTEFDGVPGVVKCADFSKGGGEELKEMLRETAAYERLQSLQGKFVPQVLYADYTLDYMMYAICTQDCGVSLRDYKGPVTEEMANQMRRCVQAVNQAGVYHGDVAARNFVVDPATGTVRLIDFGLAELSCCESDAGGLPDESRAVEEVIAKLVNPFPGLVQSDNCANPVGSERLIEKYVKK